MHRSEKRVPGFPFFGPSFLRFALKNIMHNGMMMSKITACIAQEREKNMHTKLKARKGNIGLSIVLLAMSVLMEILLWARMNLKYQFTERRKPGLEDAATT